MNIGKRNLSQFIRALFGRQHYVAFINMLRMYPSLFNVFLRYLLGIGQYPCRVKIRTPLGVIQPKIYSYYDMLTVNEIFCRLDYKADKDIKTVVDLGSNIGISALYFLTRNKHSRCYLYEPVPENNNKAHENLKEFKGRYFLEEVAVSNEGGAKRFGIEKYGRCGGLKRETGSYINVTCIHINDVLKRVLEKEKAIDILKIDTEGNELDIIEVINKQYLPQIKNIFFEIDHIVKIEPNAVFLPEYYYQKRYGNVIKLFSKSK